MIRSSVWMQKIPLFAVLAGAVALAACSARGPGGYGLFAYDCPDGAVLADQDWDKATQVSVTVRDGEYSPMVLSLRQGRAYVVTLENQGDHNLRFDAPDFFRAIALKGVRVGEGTEDETACIAGIGVPAGETITARFVTVRAGNYRFEDSGLLTALTGQAFGVIRIE